MRHFRSILYAVVLAPTVWVLVAVGLTHDLTARGRDGFAVESLTGLVLLLLGGAAYGILVFAPISPLGPFVGGLVFLVAGVWAIEAPSAYAGAWPSGVVKDGFDLSRPGYGLAALLAVPMLLTVLSVRRWRGYEPPVLPIIGQLGRARGEAPVAGTPVAAMQTAVLPAAAFGADDEDERTSFLKMFEQPADRTTVLRMAPEEEPADQTTVLRLPAVRPEGDDTTVLRLPREAEGAQDSQPTVDVAGEGPTDAQPTVDVAGEGPTDAQPTVDVADVRPTENVRDEEPTTVMVTGPATDEPTIVVGDERPTEDVRDGSSTVARPEEEPTTVMVTGSAADEPTTDEPTAGESTEAGEETADVESEAAVEAADQPAVGVAAAAEESVLVEDDEEVVEVTTYFLVADDDERARLIASAARREDGPGFELPGERTVEVRPAGRPPGETTQIIGTPGETTRIILRRNLDDTQVIGPADDGERTQMIGPGRVTPPGDDAEPVAIAGERTTVRRPGSIAAAESPNFADDPTGKIQPPVVQPDEPARTMTVMNMERPPEHAPEIPAPRKSPEDG